jgi:heat shock protein HtpX
MLPQEREPPVNVSATRFSTQARTWVLIAGLSALLVAIGGRVLGGPGYLLFGGFAVVMVFVSYWSSDRFAIRSSHAQPISEEDDPKLYAIVRDLSQRAQVPMPRVYMIPSEQPNAFATGRNPKHAAVAVTAGLRKYLPEDQIRGVLAHEFAHIKNRDILVSSIAAMIASAISAIANILQFGMIFGGNSDNRDGPFGGIAALATVLIAPMAAMVLQLGVSRQREFLADATGAAFLQDSKPLADALETLERGVAAIPMPVAPATATMYIASPLRGHGMSALFQTHPAMEERIRRLRALRFN